MTEGFKHDDGKPMWQLLPMGQVEEVVKVITMGAKKYAPGNWKAVPDARNRYIGAAYRHLASVQKGEDKDSESGLSHLAHAVCNLLFVMWFEDMTNKLMTPDPDGVRPPKITASKGKEPKYE